MSANYPSPLTLAFCHPPTGTWHNALAASDAIESLQTSYKQSVHHHHLVDANEDEEEEQADEAAVPPQQHDAEGEEEE